MLLRHKVWKFDRLFLLLVLLACMCVGCTGVPGSGTAATEVRELPVYTAVDVSGSAAVEFIHGDTPRFEITADDNLLPLIRSEVRGGTLVIEPTKSIRPSTPIVVRATNAAPLTKLSASGSVKISAREIASNAIEADLSGSTELVVQGKVAKFAVSGSGSTKIRATELQAEEVKVGVSGSGDVEVFSTVALDVSASGSAKVRYRGNPKVTKSVSGSGDVAPLGQ